MNKNSFRTHLSSSFSQYFPIFPQYFPNIFPYFPYISLMFPSCFQGGNGQDGGTYTLEGCYLGSCTSPRAQAEAGYVVLLGRSDRSMFNDD
jgi:hypothetical protein